MGYGNYESSAINQSISLISVPSFMMVCGYFMFSSKWTIQKLGFREKSLLLPFLFWSLTYFLCFHSVFSETVTLQDFLLELITAPYFCSQMWFFRTLAIITLIAYGCVKLKGHNDVIVLVLVFIGFNAVSVLLTKRFAIQSLAGNMGYFIIGYVMHKYGLLNKRWFKTLGYLCVPLFVMCMYLKINEIQMGGVIFKACNYFGVIALLSIVNLLKDSNLLSSSVVLYLGRHTLEVYTTHFLWVYIMMLIYAPVSSLCPNLCIILYAVLATILSLLIEFIIKKIPYLRTFVYGR